MYLQAMSYSSARRERKTLKVAFESLSNCAGRSIRRLSNNWECVWCFVLARVLDTGSAKSCKPIHLSKSSSRRTTVIGRVPLTRTQVGLPLSWRHIQALQIGQTPKLTQAI